MVDNLSEFELRPPRGKMDKIWWASPAKSWGFHGDLSSKTWNLMGTMMGFITRTMIFG